VFLWQRCHVLPVPSRLPIKLKFHGNDTDTDTDTDFLAYFCARILARKSACPTREAVGLPWRARPVQLADLSAYFCPTRAFPREMSVEDARVYTCTCTVHKKLSCTRLQNYTIGASLKSVSVSVSVPWNLSLFGQAEATQIERKFKVIHQGTALICHRSVALKLIKQRAAVQTAPPIHSRNPNPASSNRISPGEPHS